MKAYGAYEFHAVYHLLYNFATVTFRRGTSISLRIDCTPTRRESCATFSPNRAVSNCGFLGANVGADPCVHCRRDLGEPSGRSSRSHRFT